MQDNEIFVAARKRGGTHWSLEHGAHGAGGCSRERDPRERIRVLSILAKRLPARGVHDSGQPVRHQQHAQ